ncbi:hypothetical protein BH09BAC4_BH09BAC4_05160 [soil metagenome]
MEKEKNESTPHPIQRVGVVTNNTHFVDSSTGDLFEIESVIGYDKAGGQQTYYAWLFPEGHPARGYVNARTGKMQID